MSTIENAVPQTIDGTTVDPSPYAESAQQLVNGLRQFRELIPQFNVPASANETVRLNSAASVPAAFVELTAMAVTNQTALVRGGAASPAEVRDLLRYADTFSPVIDEVEAFAQFLRHSVASARNRAGSEALTTYALAQRLAKRTEHPEHAQLAAYVADMRRALGRAGRGSPEAVAQKAAEKAARAVERAAIAAAKVPKTAVKTPPPDTTQQS